MLPLLPRELLWQDLPSMDDFFKLDPVNEDCYEVYLNLREDPFNIQADAVKVFNEVYYQITRMFFEHPLPNDLEKYVADIKANIGWNYSAELVMSMAYFLFSLINKKAFPLNRFFTESIHERFEGCRYWKPFMLRIESMKIRECTVKYKFLPCPINVEWLKDKYIHWNAITCNYDFFCIQSVVELWHNIEDRRAVANLINDSINPITFKGHGIYDERRLKQLMKVYLMADDDSPVWMCSEPQTDYNSTTSSKRIEKLEKEKQALKNRISELEAENTRLSTLLSAKKNEGKERSFTLLQIVDYCKRKVEWVDAKSIVAMLNKLLRGGCTEEEGKLVDSIEDEFRQPATGTTYVNEQTIIPNVSNYKPQIQTQTNNLTGLPAGQVGTKQLEE